MSETKFTPGKYHVIKHSWADTSIQSDSGQILCASTIDDGDTDEDNQEEMEEWQSAQMNLFANAPAMYAAMQSFIKDFENDYVMDDGEIVDNPKNILVVNYNIFKGILAAVRGENNQKISQ